MVKQRLQAIQEGLGSALEAMGSMSNRVARALAAETHQIDLGVPLPMPLANRAWRIEGAVAGLTRDIVERVRAVGAVAEDDIAGVRHRLCFSRALKCRAYRRFCPTGKDRRLTLYAALLVDQVPDRRLFDPEPASGGGDADAGAIIDKAV